MKRVLNVERMLVQYRVDFFNRLKKSLHKRNIEFHLLHGKSKNQSDEKKDERELDWAEYVPNKILSIGDKEVIWQPIVNRLSKHDLVIVEYANRNLINYFIILKRLFTKHKMAFWGHMRNPFLNKNDLRNLIKRAYLKQCDWWFAYTEGEKNNLISAGFPAEKITVVQNAIDTKSLQSSYANINTGELDQLKRELKINSNNIAIYCGSIYKEKRMDFLIEAADIIRKEIPDFQLIILGAGPYVSFVEVESIRRDWLHYLGPKFGEERVIYFKLAKVFLMPGALGLAILDSFAMETPMVVSEYDHHGPEFEYLENGVNGILSKNNIASYASEVMRILMDKTLQNKLSANCKKDSSKYTIEAMAENFANGIQQCLATD